MSYDHPTASVNSGLSNPDPLTGVRLDRAALNYDRWGRPNNTAPDYSPFTSWQRFTEDVLHYRPFDSLDQETQDAIRLRRQRNFQNSDVPWIVTDYTSLMTAYDDIDDLLKTKQLLTEYAIPAASKAARALKPGQKPFKDERLAGWREACEARVPPRERKIVFRGFGGWNALAGLGLAALGALFPGWRLAALLLQAAQTTDSLFGVGLQLGPILGYGAELFFRGLKDTNGPIFDFTNKYEQLKAARIIAAGPRALAAAPHAHPDDALTTLTGFHHASTSDLLPYLLIDQDDYPSVSDVLSNPWAVGKEAFDAGRLAASLPYNLGAALTNELLADALAGWSEALGGPGKSALPKINPNSQTEWLMKLAEKGICPSGQCEAELAQNALILSKIDGRHAPGDLSELPLPTVAEFLRMAVRDPLSFLGL
jgi:hypothetical protein